jgi:hypothetical protein
MEMDNKEILEKINNSVRSFLKSDSYLLVHNVNERSITHKLAEHLQSEFTDYHVDCEYNKNATENDHEKDDDKKIDKWENEIKKIFKNQDKNQDATTKKMNKETANTVVSVYPDIIIHKRGSDNNLCILEVKKSTNTNTRLYDEFKLKCYTENKNDSESFRFLRYQLGLFIEFVSNKHEVGIKNIKCYVNGSPNDDLERFFKNLPSIRHRIDYN